MKEVVDTRFLMEHFYSDQPEIRRKTSQRIRELAQRGEGIIPTIVIGEVVRITCTKRGAEEANLRYLSLLASNLEIRDITADIAKEAGLLKCRYPSFPMGDCIIVSVAKMEGARVLSDDTHFDDIKEIKRVWI